MLCPAAYCVPCCISFFFVVVVVNGRLAHNSDVSSTLPGHRNTETHVSFLSYNSAKFLDSSDTCSLCDILYFVGRELLRHQDSHQVLIKCFHTFAVRFCTSLYNFLLEVSEWEIPVCPLWVLVVCVCPPPPHPHQISLFKLILCQLQDYFVMFNLLTPNVNYSVRTAPLTSKVSFYIFIQQI